LAILPTTIGNFVVRLYEQDLFYQERKEKNLKGGVDFRFAHTLQGVHYLSPADGFSLSRIEDQIDQIEDLIGRKHAEVSLAVAARIICSHLKVSVEMLQRVFPSVDVAALVEQSLAEENVKYLVMICPQRKQRQTRVKTIIEPSASFRSLLGTFFFPNEIMSLS